MSGAFEYHIVILVLQVWPRLGLYRLRSPDRQKLTTTRPEGGIRLQVIVLYRFLTFLRTCYMIQCLAYNYIYFKRLYSKGS